MNCPLLIFANKQDLVQALQPDQVSIDCIQRYLRNYAWNKLIQEHGLLLPVQQKLRKDSKMDLDGSFKMLKNDI